MKHFSIALLGLALLTWNTGAVAAQLPPRTSTDSDVADSFIGLQPGLGTLPLLGQGRTRSISAENPTGEKGKGGMAVPNPSEPKPAASARAADDLGQGWKVRPFIRLNAGETATLMDVAGSGIIQHIWLVEGLNRGVVLRCYWDNETTPSVEGPVPDFFAVGHGRFAPVNSLAVVVNPANALNCFWPMPFRTRIGKPNLHRFGLVQRSPRPGEGRCPGKQKLGRTGPRRSSKATVHRLLHGKRNGSCLPICQRFSQALQWLWHPNEFGILEKVRQDF